MEFNTRCINTIGIFNTNYPVVDVISENLMTTQELKYFSQRNQKDT